MVDEKIDVAMIDVDSTEHVNDEDTALPETFAHVLLELVTGGYRVVEVAPAQ